MKIDVIATLKSLLRLFCGQEPTNNLMRAVVVALVLFVVQMAIYMIKQLSWVNAALLVTVSLGVFVLLFAFHERLDGSWRRNQQEALTFVFYVATICSTVFTTFLVIAYGQSSQPVQSANLLFILSLGSLLPVAIVHALGGWVGVTIYTKISNWKRSRA